MEPKNDQNSRWMVKAAVSVTRRTRDHALTLRGPDGDQGGRAGVGRQVRRLGLRKGQSGLRNPACKHVEEGVSGSGCQRLGPGATLRRSSGGRSEDPRAVIRPHGALVCTLLTPVSARILSSRRPRAGEVPGLRRALRHRGEGVWGCQMTLCRSRSPKEPSSLPDVSPEALGCRGARPGPMLGGPRSPGQGGVGGWGGRGGPEGQGGALRALPGSAAAAQGRGRAMRKCQAGGRRSSGRAQLSPAARPVLPGAATRAHRRQVGPGRPRSSPRPPGTCRRRAGAWGRAGAREGSASGSARQWSSSGGVGVGSAPTAGRAPRSGGLSYVRISAGCPAPAASVPRAPGGPGGRVATNARGASSALLSLRLAKATARMGSARAPDGGLAWVLEGLPPFCALRIPRPPAPLTLSVKRMRLKGIVFAGP